ncbi:hypothetical protein CBR_g938 [Chara braunii]|uniref:Uncharacterized protein n=1 Tax=Chara braunii TaxID=69332 RepID=A0A388KCT3_CHABU|nr:hypothetical protein CBR_g938 [Chara braunii]|eukprot:GBG67817.1 hypothetical protein CBR_g938 [Chara braunii]
MFPTKQTFDRRSAIRNDRPWSPQCTQTSQSSHNMYSCTSTLSSRRSPSDPRPSVADVTWTPHCGTSVPSGFGCDATNGCDDQACEDMEDDTIVEDGDDVEHDNGYGGSVPKMEKGDNWNGRNDDRRGQKKDLEKRKELQEPLAFEKLLWDAMQWQLNKPSMICDETLGSEDLPGTRGGTPPSGRNGSEKIGSEARGTNDLESTAKMRRTSSGKTSMDDAGTNDSTLARAIEESTRSYCDGLDKATCTLAKATSDVGTAMAAKICDVAEAMRGGNTVLEMLVGVLARRYAGSATGDKSDGYTNPSSNRTAR